MEWDTLGICVILTHCDVSVFYEALFLSTAVSSTFVYSCNFEEENICGMIQGPGNAKWEQQSSASGGPEVDFTNMGQCKGDNSTSDPWVYIQ